MSASAINSLNRTYPFSSSLFAAISPSQSSNINASSSTYNQESNLKVLPKNTFWQGLIKLGMDSVFSAAIMLITYYKGVGLWSKEGFTGRHINKEVQSYLEQKKDFETLNKFNRSLEDIAVMGKVAQEAYSSYWPIIDKCKNELIKSGAVSEEQFKKHILHDKYLRKLEAGLAISALNYARAVFFAPNASWDNLDFLSLQALVAAGLPLLANGLYWKFYDKHPGGYSLQLLGLQLTATHMDLFLDFCKASAKAMKRFVPTTDWLKNIVHGFTLLIAAGGAREIRNQLERPILEGFFKRPKFGPRNNKEALEASFIRAFMKALLDTSIFTGIFGGLTIITNSLFDTTPQQVNPVRGYSYFNFAQNAFNGLTTMNQNQLSKVIA